jgi:flagellar hook-associated protein 1 FlgK
VILSAIAPDPGSGYDYGSGVTLSAIERVRDTFLDSQKIQYSSLSYSAQKQSDILSQLETLLSEPSDSGLSSKITSFFNSFEILTSDSTSSSLRSDVLNAAQSLADKLNTIYSGYQDIKTDLKNEAEEYVKSINEYVKQIQNLNKQIIASETRGTTANELMDERTRILNELSQLANISVQTSSDNSVSVSIGGIFAVDTYNSQEFKVEEQNGSLKIVTAEGGTAMSLNGGELYATTRMYNEVIPGYLDSLDEVGNAIYESVNAIHSTGYTTTDPPQTGINFFDSYENGLLTINQDILDDTSMLAISADGTDGNNEIALQLAGLQDEEVIDGETILDVYTSFTNDLANEKVLQDENATTYQSVIDQLNGQISEVSSVSIDEEMVSVLKFQSAYSASAKLISVADELFETLLNTI